MTIDERLQRAAQEVQDQFEALEPLHLPAHVTRRRSRLQSGPVAAAAGFVAVAAFGATLLWLGPFAGENPDVGGETGPPSDLTVTTLGPDDALTDTPAAQSCAEPIAEVTRTECGALTDVLDGYFGAWASHDPDAVLSYFQPEVAIVVDGPASDSESGTYRGDDARALIEGWFTSGLRTERLGEGGGTLTFHIESTIYTFGSGAPIHAINVLEFTADPFISARQEESPLVAHHIFLIGDEPSLSTQTIIDHLWDGGTLDSLGSLITGATATARTPTTPTTTGAVLEFPP